ncbi:MAG: hypothetical protein ACLP7W_14360 [Solirubrobacteraceae bacterium]|jgi:hypothetical protein
MPETKVQRRPPAPRAATSHKRPAATHKRPAENGKHKQASAVDRTTELSDEVLKSLESGQRAAIDAVRKFVDTVDEKLPVLGERPSRRQEIVDAAMEMADRLVHTQYDFLRDVVQSAGKALSKPNGGK